MPAISRRRPPLRSSVPGLSTARIAAAAIEIADEHGLDAVSMRKVAGAIGSGTMSLYRHVANRDELLDAMLDEVYAELNLSRSSTGEWRERIAATARAHRKMLRSHPWAATLVGSRPPLLPSFLDAFEASFAALLDGGLTVIDAAEASATINAFVVGYALLEHAEQLARHRTGLTKRQWRARNAPLVRTILDTGNYPAVAQYVQHAKDIHPDTAFDNGLRGILDSIEARACRPAQ
jgi:AcrR family transcriptional regulator